MPSFRTLCAVSAGFCVGTFAVLMAAPTVIYFLFDLEESQGADVMSRRAAVLFLSVGVILWRQRGVEQRETKAGLALGMFVFMAAFVILGLVEFARGAVGPGILLAVAAEFAFGAAFFGHLRATRGTPTSG
ncbi:hypothetical protein [Ilumatobacter coccineus]|nr:hypothetical protein [Ilumatobacter coccineus]